jgi:hypothetical protein
MSRKKVLTQQTSIQAGKFLFDLPSDEAQALDMRTRINSPDIMRTLLFYGVLDEALGSKVAKQIKGLMERLFISADKGLGRSEAVEVLKQNFPKRVEIEKGSDGSFE